MSREPTKLCAHCGAWFGKDPRNTWAYWGRAKYCSQRCAGLANTAQAEATRPPMADAFNRFVKKGDGCWRWTSCTDKDGYGLFIYAKKQYRAAKIALQLDGRPVPQGMYACHHCDNPICVRPDHLYPGTPAQNMADAKRRKRLNPKSKLTVQDVQAIRAATGTHDAIATSFGISRTNVTLIRNRKTWADLP